MHCDPPDRTAATCRSPAALSPPQRSSPEPPAPLLARLAGRLRPSVLVLRPALAHGPSGPRSSRRYGDARDRACSAHDSRAVPAARPRGRRLDRRLLDPDRVAARCARRSPPARCAPRCRPRPPSRASRSPPSSPTSTGSSCPGVTHWQHPGFFGYFPANTSGPSVLGDLVSAGLGVQGMSWVTSPAATELEQHVMDWLADLLGLPASFRSDRHRRRRRPGLQLRRQPGRPAGRPAPRPAAGATVRHGVDPDRATVYVSAETHSSMEKAVRIAGPRHRRRPHRRGRRRPRHAPGALAARLERDVARGYTPGAGLRHGRDDVDDGRRPAGRARPDLPEVRRLAARRRRLRRRQRRRPRAARAAGRRRVGRQLHHRRAQVAAHRLRRDAVLGRRPRRPDRRPVDPPGVPAQRRHRRRRGRRLPRLADPARPPVPRAEAVVRPPLVRRRGPARAHPRPRRARPGAGRLGRRPTSASTSSRRTRCRWSACGPAGPTTSTPTSPP